MNTAKYECWRCKSTGRYTDYHWDGAHTGKCPACKGRGELTAAKWLKQIFADPRAKLTRKDAIGFAAEAIGMAPDGTVAYGKDRVGQCEGPMNGVAGLVVDMEEHGHLDVLARFLPAWHGYAREGQRKLLEELVPRVRAARAEVRASKAA